ncbi:hypothetical protein ACFFMN_34105 [Planobispora siamensis]|uniref:Secreted protein n=1 Tax=Planobispora siamensis TaxID=936338 RepID=A0A8J3SCL2_9ACTN|nr:hypothetical protein [Planobispora siamensis]GIH91912.1 hypothetical protein Psi01_25420 [Planobispora siamensis]
MTRTRWAALVAGLLLALAAVLFTASACGGSAESAPAVKLPLPDLTADCNGDDIISPKEKKHGC